jgi:hypothetical protein
MARFMAVHTMPMTEEQAMAMTKNLKALPRGISWKYTWADFKDGKFFCEWYAPSKEAIEQVFKSVKMPCDAVYPVRLFDVAKNKFVD